MDSGGDGIPMWYLNLVDNLDEPNRYNWGGAVLAHLYRQLCAASVPCVRSMHGPVMLLQHWSWTRLPVHRPVSIDKDFLPSWGYPTIDTCPAFAEKWCSKHRYVGTSHSKSSEPRIPRNQIQQLTEDMVEWQPYEDIYNQLSSTTLAGRVLNFNSY